MPFLRVHAFAWLAFVLLTGPAGAAAPGQLSVSEDGRYLVEDGKPFFYLGDTAWELFHRLTFEEADRYLTDRAAKGFNVVQAVALAELDGLRTPNAYGHVPLKDDDPAVPLTRPGPANDYWDHVDAVIDRAAELGMHTALLPTWGDKWNLLWGVGPVVFTPENAEQYGRWIGERYRDRPIIWVLGGDRSIDEPGHAEVIHAMARGLEAAHGGRQLMTYHPRGGFSSAEDFHEAAWLDFNMAQSGHHRPHTPGADFARRNAAREPRKPTLDGEPCYEDHPHKGAVWDTRHEPGAYLPWFDEADVRHAGYTSVLSGACGHTYGDHNLWQFWAPGREPISIARTPWTEALGHPGARQMGYLKRLFEARPFWRLTESRGFAESPEGDATIQPTAAIDAQREYAVVYLPRGGSVSVKTSEISGTFAKAWWFNPRQNATQLIGRLPHRERRTFVAPGSGQDWVLVIDADDADLPRLGFSRQHFEPTPSP